METGPGLPAGTYLRNLVEIWWFTDTRFTYHRTWETGLRVAIRVTTFSPAFFCPSAPKSRKPITTFLSDTFLHRHRPTAEPRPPFAVRRAGARLPGRKDDLRSNLKDDASSVGAARAGDPVKISGLIHH
jgi:hypothetical protein